MKPRLFVELFAGSAAVSLRLLRADLRPPVAYMGSKNGLASAILAAAGLHPGEGAEAVLLCDAGPWGWAWQALAVPETCRAVAAVLRSWSGEHPKALWDRLAASPVPVELVERAATVLWLQGRTASNCPLIFDSERWQMGDLPRKGGVKDPVQRSQVKLALQGLTSKGEANERHGGGLRSPSTVARRCDNIAEAVARWVALSEGAAFNKPVTVKGGGESWEHPGYIGYRPDLGIRQPNCESLAADLDKIGWDTPGYGHLSKSAIAKGFKARLNTPALATETEHLGGMPGPLAVVHGDIDHALALLPDDLSGCVVYMDPPYVGCTSYAATCPRDRVLEVARDLDRRGALVMVSEAVPLAELGWHTLNLTAHHGAHWQKRRVKSEWLTMNREPVAMPGALALPMVTK